MAWQDGLRIRRLGWLICLSVRLFPTHSGIQSGPNGEGCLYRTASFEEAILLAANLGDDADTVAAVTGQLAGAHYGASRIPERWLERLYRRADIETLALCLR